NEVPSSQSDQKQENHHTTTQSSLPETGQSHHEQSTQLLGGLCLLLGSIFVAKQTHKNID
ncbi:LPXTG cell wall anchor domain-containing protein, partial [Staphylococcus aureus]|nr:LPXTG cell wall anchor domain-containing protein [Staphylococcus aureus]